LLNGLVVLTNLEDVKARVQQERQFQQFVFMWGKQGYMEGIVLDMSAIASPKDLGVPGHIFSYHSNACYGWRSHVTEARIG
jgi:hypothetical protein